MEIIEWMQLPRRSRRTHQIGPTTAFHEALVHENRDVIDNSQVNHKKPSNSTDYGSVTDATEDVEVRILHHTLTQTSTGSCAFTKSDEHVTRNNNDNLHNAVQKLHEELSTRDLERCSTGFLMRQT